MRSSNDPGWRSAAGAVLLAGAALVGASLTAGCGDVVDGKPTAAPGAGGTEPTFPTTRRPTTSPPTPTPSTSSPTSTPAPTGPAPAGATPLSPDSNGYVFIETKSGSTRCQINKDSVGCEAPFTHSPMREGEHANGVHITAAGDVEWVLGNLGAIPTVAIDYKVYDAVGWTIDAKADGTRFTNRGTNHGMFVSLDKVDTF